MLTANIVYAGVQPNCSQYKASIPKWVEFTNQLQQYLDEPDKKRSSLNFLELLTREQSLGLLLFFFDQLPYQEGISPEVINEFKTIAEALCVYEHGKVPDKGIDPQRFADLLGVIPGPQHQGRVISSWGLKEQPCIEGYPCLAIQKYMWVVMATYIAKSNLYTFHDKPMIHRVSRLLEELKDVAVDKSILEVGAGTGDIYRALLRKRHKIKAIDNYSDAFFGQLSGMRKETATGVTRADIFKDFSRWQDHSIILSFAGPGTNELISHLAHDQYPRIFVSFINSDPDQIEPDRMTYTNLYGKNRIYFKVFIDLGVKSIHSGLFSTIVYLSEPIDHDRIKDKTLLYPHAINFIKILKIKTAAEDSYKQDQGSSRVRQEL